MTKMTTVCFKDDEYEIIKEVSNMHGESVISFMRNTILDRIEDSLDCKEAVASKEESKGETVSRKEIMNRLGFKKDMSTMKETMIALSLARKNFYE